MEAIKQLQQRVVAVVFTVSAASGIGLIAVGQPRIGEGLILGSLFSIANFIILSQSIQRQMRRGPKSARRLAAMSRAGRYLLLALPVLTALKVDDFDLPATVAGVFMVQLTILASSVIGLLRGKSGMQL
jgi:hypothetical protein